jgi:DNA-directed RNA polymerase specialized sigma24 family protein
MIDLQDPTLQERLRRRAPEGRYEISEIALVLAIRECDTRGNIDGSRMLCEVLVDRSKSTFQHCARGLSHRPDLREEAEANMTERLLREARDSKEIFITQNFIHALRMLCIDEFKRTLRQEGLLYRRDSDGRPGGRPHHVPRSLMESLQPTPVDSDAPPAADVADPLDHYDQLHAREESMRILNMLDDPLDRMIMVLRVLRSWKWDEIAQACKRNERTIRLRYEKACSVLKILLVNEEQITIRKAPQHSRREDK